MRRFLQFIERRLHPRYPVYAEVTFEVIDSHTLRNVSGPHRAVMADVCGKGCSLLVDRVIFDGFYLLRCLEDGGAHTIHVSLFSDTSEAPLAITGRIAWIDNVSANGNRGFRIGLETSPCMDAKMIAALRRTLTEPVRRPGGEKTAHL